MYLNYIMLLNYNSIFGVPTINLSGQNVSNSSYENGKVNIPSPIILIIVVLIFVILSMNLGKQDNTVISNGDNKSSQFLTIILLSVFILVFVINGLMYFFNINLTAELTDIFSSAPKIDIAVSEPSIKKTTSDETIGQVKPNPEVFHIPNNLYTYENANDLCKAYGARLANYNEIEKSYKEGAEWCSYGWSEGQQALFPTQEDTYNKLQEVEGHENDCGRIGINGGYIANPNVRFGVNCYGIKPNMSQQDKDAMINDSLYPKTLQDMKEQKKVDFWKRRIPNILVSPFNKNVWSMV